MSEPAKRISLGTIKLYDRIRHSGVIAIREEMTRSGESTDLYFEVSPDDPLRLRLREGQLVQFVEEEVEGAGKLAKEIEVVSDNLYK